MRAASSRKSGVATARSAVLTLWWPGSAGHSAAIRQVTALLVLALYVSPSMGTAAVSGSRLAGPHGAETKTVLFVGNSLTYVNDLPGLVEALARGGEGPTLRVEMVAFPDYSLEDHWNRGTAVRMINGSRWTVVVLQQGPSAAEGNRALLVDYARRFAEIIHQVGGTPALYMVWPTADRPEDFTGASASYRQAAAAVDGLLLPVGDAWRAAWRRDSTLKLYAADGLHPSLAGSYLAALVIAQALTSRSALGMPDSLRLTSGARLALPHGTALVLRNAAANVRE